MEFNENESTAYQNLTSKGKVLREEFRAMNVYIKNAERYQINDLTLHLKLLEKQEQAKP
jgi:hypothetical protein